MAAATASASWPVDVLHHAPAVGLEALRRVFGEPAGNLAVDGDAVVVVEHDQLAELQVSRRTTPLRANAFHEAAVADEAVGVVIDDRRAVLVVLRCEQFLGERHAHGVGEALAQRARSSVSMPISRSRSGCPAVRAPSWRNFFSSSICERIARQMQQRVQQHRAVAVREHEDGRGSTISDCRDCA